jgi:argininosuccinate synthase
MKQEKNSKANEKKEKVILAYSGGLDTSVILKWLLDKNYDVVCVLIDLGQVEDFKAEGHDNRFKDVMLSELKSSIKKLKRVSAPGPSG